MKKHCSRREALHAAGLAGVGGVFGASASAYAEGTTFPPCEPEPLHGPMLREIARQTPVIADCDLCVVGGGTAGVFAAVTAARLGLSVCLIENLAYFGGVATASLVNVWHSIYDTNFERQVIGGLTTEVIRRLQTRGAVTVHSGSESQHFVFNSAELAMELDELVRETGVRPFLHTRFVAPVVEDGRVTAVIIEDKSGRRAIRAKCFIDASGDGDLVDRCGLATRKDTDIQPPTTCAIVFGLDEVARQNPDFDLARAVFDPNYAGALENGFLWSCEVPGVSGARMVAGTRVHGADCSLADQLTHAEIEGRRQVRAMCDLIRANFAGGDSLGVAALPARTGIRESRHAVCLHTLTEEEVLRGRPFPDAIANGTYRVDIHYPDQPGLVFRYLDGREVVIIPGQPTKTGRWREETTENPAYYQIPYRSLVPRETDNVLVAGRLIDADRGAFGAVRVMVTCNQMGQAAGTAAYLAMQSGISVAAVNPETLRASLRDQGAVVL